MKNKGIIIFIAVSMMLTLVACSQSNTSNNADISSNKSTGRIYLYGEQHGNEKILEKEFELWSKYYNEENMRHLFIEIPYYTAEFLNIWMREDNDIILDEVFRDWKGTVSYKLCVKEFYKKIKAECPETVFHGTDVGHQYDTTGQRFLTYLKLYEPEDTEKYELTKEAIEQGEYYYSENDDKYRENKMVENFIREFEKLDGESVMGIYGAAHTNFEAMAYNAPEIPCMANQLKKRYGDAIYSEDLTWIAKDIEPIRVDRITINNKEYEASYFGKENFTLRDYVYREFWRLENAYDDFKNNKKTGDVLPYNNYPMLIETGQVFVIDLTKKDGSVERLYYRSDGYIWNGLPSTEEFIAE